MATVTGYTAERMKNIEDKTVTDGEVTGDNLILTTRDGTPIDAGNVRGPQGLKGDVGEVSQAELDAVTGKSADAGNDLTIGTDGKLFFDHDKAYVGNVPIFADTAQRDTAIPVPVLGQLCVVVQDPYRWNGTRWLSLSYSVINYAQHITNILGIPASAAGTLIPGTALPNVVLLPKRRYRVSGRCWAAPNGASTCIASITEGVNGIAGISTYQGNAGNQIDMCPASILHTSAGAGSLGNKMDFPPGSHAWQMQVAVVAGGYMGASSAEPAWVMVEDLGPY